MIIRNLVWFLVMLAGSVALGQQSVLITDLRLRETAGTTGQYSFRHNGDGVLRSYNAAGVETGSWDSETGTFDGEFSGTIPANQITAGTLGTDVVVQDGSLSANIPLKNAIQNDFTGTITADTVSGNYGMFESGLTGAAGQMVAYANELANYAPLASPVFTGTPEAVEMYLSGGLLLGAFPVSVNEVTDPVGSVPRVGSSSGFYGSFYGNGEGLTVAPAKINAGTLPVGVAVGAGNITGGTLSNSVLDSDLAAIGNNATNGIIARTGSGTISPRAIAGSTDISVTNGDGVSGNPTITAGANLVRFSSGLTFTDEQITLGSGYTSTNGGLHVQDTNAFDAYFTWSIADNWWTANGQAINAAVFYGDLWGDGAQVSNINASNIASGTISDLRLSSNVALENVTNVFSTSQDINASGASTNPGLDISLDAYSANVPLHLYDGFYNYYFGGPSGYSKSGQWFHMYAQSSVFQLNSNVPWTMRYNGSERIKLNSGGTDIVGNLSASGLITGAGVTSNGALSTFDGVGTGFHYYDSSVYGIGAFVFSDDLAGTPILYNPTGTLMTGGISKGGHRGFGANGTLDLNDYYMELNPSVGSFTVTLPATAPIGTEYYGSIINGHATNTVSFDANSDNIHAPGWYSTSPYVLPDSTAHRWVRINKIASTVWSIDTGLSN